MSWFGIAARLGLFALAFLVLVGPHWVSLRFGHGHLAARIPPLFHRLFLLLFGLRVTQVGTPPPMGEAALVLSNHVSWLDIVVLGSLRPLSFVAKSEIAGWPLIGTLARLQQTVFIDRGRRSDTAAVNATIGERLADGDLIVLFAEGTTGDGLRLLPFRSALVGAARDAISNEVGGLARMRLQPLALAYTHRNGLPLARGDRPDIAWYGDMDLAPHLSGFPKVGPIDVQVVWGAPIAYEAGTDRKRVTALAEATVRRSLRDALSGRVPPRVAGEEAHRPDIEGADVSAPEAAPV